MSSMLSDSMKHKISVTIEEDILLKSFEKIRDRTFRNKSYMVEYALFKLLDGDRNK